MPYVCHTTEVMKDMAQVILDVVTNSTREDQAQDDPQAHKFFMEEVPLLCSNNKSPTVSKAYNAMVTILFSKKQKQGAMID